MPLSYWGQADSLGNGQEKKTCVTPPKQIGGRLPGSRNIEAPRRLPRKCNTLLNATREVTRWIIAKATLELQVSNTHTDVIQCASLFTISESSELMMRRQWSGRLP